MPDRSSRRWLALPSGHLTPIERCVDPVWLIAARGAAANWIDQFPRFTDAWVRTVIAESPRHAHLHTALGRMCSTNESLRTSLAWARGRTVLYSFTKYCDVALCHRDTAFEGGPSKLTAEVQAFEKGLIARPPCLVRLGELDVASRQGIDIVVLPPSPQLSNLLRVQVATPALIRVSTLERVWPKGLE